MAVPWNAAEYSILRKAMAERMPRMSIPALFPYRPPGAVLRKLHHISPRYAETLEEEKPGPVTLGDTESTLSVRNRHQDLAFQTAMLKAIRSGREKAPIGVHVAPDSETWTPRYFPRLAESRSLYSSSAALCAEG